MPELSELDAAILQELQKNARATNRSIAEVVHVAPSTSLERIRSLRERGVIRGYHAEADLAALGREVQALIAIRIRPPSRENIEAFRDWAHGLPETVGVFVVSGGDDFLLHVAVPDTDALYAFVIDRLTERPEVADVNTSVVYEHLRKFAIDPLGAATGDAPRR
jgi:DNA-binding Lrp family transcriptional regulator